MEVASWEHGCTNLGGILAPAKTVKPQALSARILVAGEATRDEAASDTPRPSQSRNSDASFLTANPGGVATADAWAYRQLHHLRQVLQQVLQLIESQDYACEDECFTLEFDIETMRA